MDPMPYFEEALRRDPGNAQVNTQLGLMAYKDQNWDKAESYLRKAVERVTARYTRPRDCESLYYLGLTLRQKGFIDEAYDWLYRASWDADWHTASYLQLAQIDCTRGGRMPSTISTAVSRLTLRTSFLSTPKHLFSENQDRRRSSEVLEECP